jgi:hypothetical protein
MSQITENELELDSAFQLGGLDRCDLCGAQAYVRATVSTGDLLFCAHHAAQFKDKLAATALEWHDESYRLLDDQNA